MIAPVTDTAPHASGRVLDRSTTLRISPPSHPVDGRRKLLPTCRSNLRSHISFQTHAALWRKVLPKRYIPINVQVCSCGKRRSRELSRMPHAIQG